MSVPAPHFYRRKAVELGRDPALADRVLEIERRIGATGAQPVYTLGHLAQLTGAPWRYLRSIVARRRDPYVDIDRPKRGGRTRPISSPEPVLMDVQRWILHNVLSALDPHPLSYAYRPGRSVVDCARMHVGARWLIKLDLHGFFDSVRERSVFPIFVELGYPRLVALELTRLCTRVKAPHPVQRRLDRHQVAPPYWVNFEGQLPQGAPTSGMLANAVMRRADEDLSDLAQAQGLVYTRYSDDIVLSAGPGYSRQRAASVVTRASAILRANGFSVHRAKTRIIPPGSRQVILGLLVDHDQVRLLPTYKRRIEVHIRGVARFGLVEHAQHRGFESVLSMINHIDGCIAFAHSVEPAFADTVRDRWATTLASVGYLRTPTS